jgi:hypothetical protein
MEQELFNEIARIAASAARAASTSSSEFTARVTSAMITSFPTEIKELAEKNLKVRKSEGIKEDTHQIFGPR